MAGDDDNFGGFVTPADKALEGVANVVKLVLAGTAILIGWLVRYWRLAVLRRVERQWRVRARTGDQSARVTADVASPHLDRHHQEQDLLVIAALTAGVLFSAYCANKGWRDFPLNFGSVCACCWASTTSFRVDSKNGQSGWRSVREDGQDVSHPVLF
jgi:hypothetical protein